MDDPIPVIRREGRRGGAKGELWLTKAVHPVEFQRNGQQKNHQRGDNHPAHGQV